MRLAIYKVLLILTCAVVVTSEIIKTKNGALNGTTGRSRNGRIFRKFYAIPFAQPPTGNLRFKPPREAKSWENIRDASVPSNVCIQPETYGVINSPIHGNEDCLYLNVFTPDRKDIGSNKLATIVYIHGGGFQSGAGSEYNPEYFLDYPIILVTLNYRLGLLGFLGMNNDIITGNLGMKDQVLALKWVKDNIETFGGDPDNVCLMGESAGAASVHLHMFSPLSKGLFHKAIMQSGSTFSSWAYYDEQYTAALSTALALTTGCFYKDPKQILRCLQNVPAEDLSQTETRLYVWQSDPTVLFKLTIESNVTHQPFLPAKPTKENYVTSNIPWIIGINSGEGIFKVVPYLANGGSSARIIDSNRLRFIPLLNQYLYTTEPEFIDDATDKIIRYYFGSKHIGPDSDSKFVDMLTDSLFTYPLVRTILSSSGPRYVYLFDHLGRYAFESRLSLYPKNLGVGHADEIPLLFYQQKAEEIFTPADYAISKSMLDFWTNFAINSDPNDKPNAKIWKPVETSGVEYLRIMSNGVVMEKDLFKERYLFWDSLPLGRKFA